MGRNDRLPAVKEQARDAVLRDHCLNRTLHHKGTCRALVIRGEGEDQFADLFPREFLGEGEDLKHTPGTHHGRVVEEIEPGGSLQGEGRNCADEGMGGARVLHHAAGKPVPVQGYDVGNKCIEIGIVSNPGELPDQADSGVPAGVHCGKDLRTQR